MLRSVLLAAGLLSSPAFARNLPPRPEPTIAVTLSERTRPSAPQPVIARPALAAEHLDAALGVPIGTLDPAALQRLETKIGGGTLSGDEQLRVAYELAIEYDRHARHWRASAAALQLLVDREVDRARHAKLSRDAVAAATKAKDFLLKGVKTFRTVTDRAPLPAYADDALFRFGYLLESFKYMKEARTAFDSLLKNFPNSRHVPSAHLAFAEYYFESGQLADAEARYKHVLKFPKSPQFHYAKYKLGWVNFQLQRYQEALEMFFEVSRVGAGFERLVDAARLDFVRAYAEIGKADKAHAAFGRLDARSAFDMLVHLGRIYVEQGKSDRAWYVFGELQKLAPNDARVCEWQYQITRASFGAGTVDDRIKAIEDLIALDVALAAKGKLPVAAARLCRSDAIATSTELGRAFHAEFSKTRNPITLDAAIRLYQAYLVAFPADAGRPAIAALLAEALWTRTTIERDPAAQLRLAERTAAAFTQLATIDPTRAVDARRAALVASSATIDDAYVSTIVPPLSKGAPAPAQPLLAREAALIDTIHALAASMDPRDPELGMLRFAEANILRKFHQHAQAAPIYAALLATHPNAAFSEAAAVLAIDSLVLVQKLDDMLLLADKLAADQRFLADKPELTAVVKYVRSRSMRH